MYDDRQRKITSCICRACRTPWLPIADIRVIGFNVKPGWIAETVHETLESNIHTIGKKPKYVITDNDYKMRKAVALSDYIWHRDISHTLAMFMERTYKKDADFVDFSKRMATCKKQYCMKEVAYLQPPSQRTKARFMNLSDNVDWANTMLYMFNKLSPYECVPQRMVENNTPNSPKCPLI